MRALLWCPLVLVFLGARSPQADERIASVAFAPDKSTISMHWREAQGQDHRNIGRLKAALV